LQLQSKEEQWFMCVADDLWRQSSHALGFCRGTAFRALARLGEAIEAVFPQSRNSN
jgi:hypothetical protein